MSYLECAAGCTIRDQHLSTCDGWRHHDGERPDEVLRECTGCVPKPANFGCLCTGDWYRLVDAITEWSVLESKLDENDVLSPREPGLSRSHQGPRVPLPQTYLDADEVRSWLGSYTGDARSWVSTVNGARDAVRFTRAVEHAARSHKYEEKPRILVRMRCPRDSEFVSWYPPAEAFEPMEAKCGKCGWHVTEEDQFKLWRKTYRGDWEEYTAPAMDVVAEIEMGRKSVMSFISEGESA